MIPRYRSPFCFSTIMLGLMGGCTNSSVSHIEEAYANYFSMPYSVLLPSCRAGMSWALEIGAAQPKKVLCTAYTCTTVVESVIKSGAEFVGIDIANDHFLADYTFTKSLEYQSLILSEIYGYTYDLNLWKLTDNLPGIRIVDMAMSVPEPHHFQRLTSTDFAVLSFGTGKCLYAGCGGMGFSHDENLITEIKKWRDKRVEQESLLLLIKHSMEILFRNIAREPFLYKYFFNRSSHKRPERAQLINDNIVVDQQHFLTQPRSKEWYMPTTPIDRYLMGYNLNHSTEYAIKRIGLADRYSINLKNVNSILLPPPSTNALSHFTIRVNQNYREILRQCLCDMGIETGTLFFLSRFFKKHNFPNAARTAAEVINLPLDVRMRLSDVDWICACLLRALKKLDHEDIFQSKTTE